MSSRHIGEKPQKCCNYLQLTPHVFLWGEVCRVSAWTMCATGEETDRHTNWHTTAMECKDMTPAYSQPGITLVLVPTLIL